ncbi:MAG: hypothetical protein NTY53_02760, partial [Kiritimatiellaeota bacterium]|nr:hypothetical protein [Kiritimatiellota bacterium]
MTTIWLSLGLALLVGCAWLFTATSARGMGRPPPAKPAVTNPATNALTVADVKGLNRAAIRAMLKRLATTRPPEPPEDIIRGSRMISCYLSLPSPTNTAYVCAICGEKTLYLKERVGEVQFEIPYFRQIVREIQAVVGKA